MENHKEKQEMFDKYAKSKGFEDWKDLFEEFFHYGHKSTWLENHIFSACDLVQAEHQERIAENALIRHDLNKLNEPNLAEYGKYFGGEGSTFYTVEKTSITNPENKIQ